MSRAEQVVISPSLLSADFGCLRQAGIDAAQAGAEYLHFDVMDGQFVPNLTMGPHALSALRPHLTTFFDVHLMIVQPERYVEDFVKAGANGVTVQVEACTHLQRTLALIRHAGAKAGVALNPATPIDYLDYVLDDVDLILVMTVNPGFGGQKFLPATVAKIAQVRERIESASHPIHLEVDGGIGHDTVSLVTRAGATALVAGTAIFEHPHGVTAGIRELRQGIVTEPASKEG